MITSGLACRRSGLAHTSFTTRCDVWGPRAEHPAVEVVVTHAFGGYAPPRPGQGAVVTKQALPPWLRKALAAGAGLRRLRRHGRREVRTEMTSVAVDRVDVDGDPALGLVTLNRPDEMNPLDWDTVRELGRILDTLAADPAVRVIAITGAGRAFSAGGDMKKYRTLQRDAQDFPQFLADIHEIFQRIPQYPKPVVALVNGIAVAGGLELVLFCDFAFMAESARIGDAHLPYGQMGGGGVLTMLPRMIGPARARELIVTGRLLRAEEAMSLGPGIADSA